MTWEICFIPIGALCSTVSKARVKAHFRKDQRIRKGEETSSFIVWLVIGSENPLGIGSICAHIEKELLTISQCLGTL